MTKIYLIRAAEAEGELYRIAQGHYDSALTERGWRQAKALGKHFAGIQIDGVYASDLYSACATASVIYQPKGLEVCQREDLREVRLGTWEGRSWGNIAYEEPRQLRNFKSALQNWYVDDAETAQQVLDRMEKALLQISAEHPGKAVAVVSHGFAIRLLLAKLLGKPLEETHTVPVGENTAVSILESDGGALRLVSRDDTGHLMDAEYQACEKPRTEPDFDTDMCCYLLRWVEYGEAMAEAVECVWQESGDERPFDRDILLEDAGRLQTTVGYVEQTPAGFLQMGAQPGWITLLCTHPGCRGVGLGTQLIGQAVMDARNKGANALHIALSKRNPHRQFFQNLGFSVVGEMQDGRDLLEKDISLAPEFLKV